MKVEIKISEEAVEPHAVIYAREESGQVRKMAAFIASGPEADNVITVSDSERFFVLRPEEIYMIRVENEKTAVYSKTEKYSCGKRLYEFEALLGGGFMRVSKSVLVNLKYLDYVEPYIGGVMVLILKNGCKEYISRKYLPAFKKYLGI